MSSNAIHSILILTGRRNYYNDRYRSIEFETRGFLGVGEKNINKYSNK